MAYLTDRKRATGLGSAKSGTHHHWHMTVTSVMLLGLVPLFVFTLGTVIGEPHATVAAARPFPALVAGLALLVGFVHFKNGIQSAIEDYSHGLWRKGLLIATTSLSYTAAAVAIFALIRLAL